MFIINNIMWQIVFVPSDSNKLMRSDGSISLAVTDFNDKTVYVSDDVKNGYLRKVMAHELCHCFCFSYNIYMPIQQEEYLADWISLYGAEKFSKIDKKREYLLEQLNSKKIKKQYLRCKGCWLGFKQREMESTNNI